MSLQCDSILFKLIRKGCDGDTEIDESVEDNNEIEQPINVLCIIHKNGKVGSAYYNFQEKLIYNKTFCFTFFTAYEICKAIISQLNLASNAEEPSEVKREVYIHSLINFEHRLSIQATGALIKYLDKNWAFFGIDKDDLQYLQINQVTRKDHILVDTASFNALHIFSQRGHDASFKRGLQSSSREGLSVYKLFSANCKSRIGQITLRNILLNPIKNIEELNKRLDFINFVLQPSNKDFIECLQENMKQLGNDINVILTRIQNSRANDRDWHVLYKTIYHTIFINDISSPYREKSMLLMELQDTVSSDLVGLENSIENEKLRQQDIAKDVTAAARFTANDLPDFLNECSVVYLPEMGHLIAIKEWEPNCNPEQLQDLGFQFMFTLRNMIHYKNPLCVELDKRLGDITAEIIDHENRILRRLSGFILKYNKDIREPLKIIGLMDCLISMAITASQNMYVRPSLNNDSIFEIEDSRHLLMEHIITQFQPNSFYSGGNYSHMKIITGPNGSGKSVYLKQIALIVFLAHVGSYVPAKNANIGVVHSIHSRMQATESASVRLSAFMIDVSQITQALNSGKSSSLILMDEFGRGTTDDEGMSLLVGVLRQFLDRKHACPHVVLSTHFQQITEHLPKTSLIEYQKMDHSKDNGMLYFLYKVTEGVSNSFAFDIAEAVGLDKDVLTRAREIMDCLKHNKPIRPLERNKSFRAENLTELDIPEPKKGIIFFNINRICC
ncbi:hypothetical protein NQ314_004868 [Rhamnusium bicolor]|uniref:DNA mismatch repair proteins mutS family domain-containing protein n=1 Tax=Rhamnusium bicolor TaxID=1586634 RepID=A0AAV8ZKU6_9CUCU|nr:hypothetical protein NQ314_004868 [Rhamnusium bicolor]